MEIISCALRRMAASRWLLLGINAAIVLISLDSLMDMLALASDTIANLTDLENTSDAVATIFIAYGVAAEERASLMEFGGVYPALRTPTQEALDHASHYYGLAFLVVGLFMEIGVQLIKLPDNVLDTHGMEYGIFAVNALFILLGLWLFFRYSQQVYSSNKASQAVQLESVVQAD